MTELIPTPGPLLPLPTLPITIRPATLDDVPFMDGLQKLHTKQVGWMPTKQFEGKIQAGHVLIAEQVDSQWSIVDSNAQNSSLSTTDHRLSTHTPLGYCIGNDQYFKRDDVGIIYQMNVVPGKQRGLIGASLLKAQFERSAYGCKLYCCWCAQDIAANRFWEACGFVPLAFRAGSEKKQRIHIFWSKRIRDGDTTTPWWFPSQTQGGSIMEDRLVFPIPPDTHWSDAKPIILPRHTHLDAPKQIEDKAAPRTTKKIKPPLTVVTKRQPQRPPLSGGLSFHRPEPEVAPVEKPKREKKPKVKNDPKFVSAARELRDRWLEEVNAGRYLPTAHRKYDVTRAIEPSVSIEMEPTRLLDAA